jgi:CHAT domain-containing protein
MEILVDDVKETISRLRTLVYEDYLNQRNDEFFTWKIDLLYDLINGEFYRENVHCITSLSSADIFYLPIHDYSKAETFYQQALKIIARIRGKNHLDYIKCLYTLALLKVITGQTENAFTIFEQAIDFEDTTLIKYIFSTAPEREKTAFLKIAKDHLDLFLSFVLQYYPTSPTTIRKAMDVALRRKSIAAEASIIQRRGVLHNKNLEIKNKIRDLDSTSTQINDMELSGPDWDASSEGWISFHTKLEQLKSKKEILKRELEKETPELEFKLELSYSNKIANSLSESSVAVEFIKLAFFNFKALPDLQGELWMAPRYIAFVLSDKHPSNVYLLDFGDANIIDQLIYSYKYLVTKKKINKFLVDRIKNEKGPPLGNALRLIVFDPLLNIISNCDRVYISPDGELAKIPFEILPIDNSDYVVDKFCITYLGSCKDLLHFKPSTNEASYNSSVIIADPDFGLGNNTDTEFSIEEILVPPGNYYLNSPYFPRLPGTKEEGEIIGRILGVEPQMGKDALESYLKSCKSPYILHISTHGFFLPKQRYYIDNKVAMLPLTESAESLGMTNRLTGYNLQNPMLRSGLALAGANTWIKYGSIPGEHEDGILTAEDVSLLDLSDTELVVLSACETGLGDTVPNEGIFGLRRAFVLAGAQTLVISLWNVQDRKIVELMAEFYNQLLTGEPRADALLKSQLFIKKKDPDPYYWGAFICQGNPGSLARLNVVAR